jgi:hypothetical protein
MRLAEKFYPTSIDIDVSADDELKSDQLHRLISSIDDKYIILLEDDFYLIRPVDMDLMNQVCEFCVEHSVDRFSLQSKNAYSINAWTKTNLQVGGHAVYAAHVNATLFALEASVWKCEFLVKHMARKQSDAQIERKGSRRVRRNPHKVYALDTCIMHYRDAIRNGRRVLQVEENPLRITTTFADRRHLYPNDEGPEMMLL